jgi:quercetin dioxygenase-like cupin family protein
MRSRRTLAAVLAMLAAACGARQLSAQPKPITVTRIFTGADGEAHAEEREVKLPALAGRQQSETIPAANSQFVRFPPGYLQDRHTASKRRYLITLSGRGEVEVGAGKKIVVEPGRVLQMEDLTGQGHVTRTLGNADWVVLEVQFDP